MPKLLYVDVKWPTPASDAASQRAVQLIRELVQLGFDVDVAAMFPPEASVGSFGPRDLAGGTAIPAESEAEVADHVARHGMEYDVAVLAWTRVARRLLPLLRETNPDAFIVFDTVDVNHVREFRHARVSRNANILRRAMAMKQHELAAVAAADCTLAVTEVDAEVLRHHCPEARVEVVTLGVDLPEGPIPNPMMRAGALYLGNFQAWGNVDAVQQLVHEILPEVRALGVELGITLAGAGSHADVDELASPEVTVLGYAPDLRQLFDRHRMFVCPLRIGSGIKGKLLTALAMGLPSVASPVAIEGIGLTDGQHCLVATTPREFATAISRLNSDDALWLEISRAGRALARSRFSHEVVRRQVRDVFARPFEYREPAEAAG